MAEAGFRLPGASYEELVNIIVAYGTRDEASNPGDVGKLDSVHRASASRTNGFLVEIGVLKGEREKLVTRRGKDLALALDRRDEPESRRVWRQIVSISEFLQNVVSAVKFREGMPYETVQAYIAHSAGQPRNKPVMIGSSTVIEILKSARLLKEDATGNISVAHEGDILEPAPANGASTAPPETSTEDITVSASTEVEDVFSPENTVQTTAPGTGATVNIHLHVRCDASDLDEVAPKLQALLRTLREDAASERSGSSGTPDAPGAPDDLPPSVEPSRDFADVFGGPDAQESSSTFVLPGDEPDHAR